MKKIVNLAMNEQEAICLLFIYETGSRIMSGDVAEGIHYAAGCLDAIQRISFENQTGIGQKINQLVQAIDKDTLSQAGIGVENRNGELQP